MNDVSANLGGYGPGPAAASCGTNFSCFDSYQALPDSRRLLVHAAPFDGSSGFNCIAQQLRVDPKPWRLSVMDAAHVA